MRGMSSCYSWMFFIFLLGCSLACCDTSRFEFAALETIIISMPCVQQYNSGKNTGISPYFEALKVGLHIFYLNLISRSSPSVFDQIWCYLYSHCIIKRLTLEKKFRRNLVLVLLIYNSLTYNIYSK